MKCSIVKLICITLSLVMLLLVLPAFALADEVSTDTTAKAVTETPSEASDEAVPSVSKKITALKDGVLVAANAGDWFYYPENSIEGIRYCASMGIDLIMLDVFKTKDGEFVAAESNNISQSCISADGSNAAGKVSAMTLAELQVFYLREGKGGYTPTTGLQIPEITQAVSACAGSITPILNVSPGNADALYKKLQSAGLLESVIFSLGSNVGNVIDWASEHTDALVIGSYSGSSAARSIHKYVNAGIDVISLSGGCLSDFSDGRTAAALDSDALGIACIAGSKKDCVDGWETLISAGITIIETDYPTELSRYLSDVDALSASLQNLVLRCQSLYDSASSHFNSSEITSAFEAAKSISESSYPVKSELEVAQHNLIVAVRNAQAGSRVSSGPSAVVIIIIVVVLAAIAVAAVLYKKKFSKKLERK